MKLLIVNADDFGLNDAATDAIIETHLAGSVTSTTLMVNAPAAERAAALAAQHTRFGVGLHFNLTWGRPVADPGQVRSLLAADGSFLSRETLSRRLLTRAIPAAQVRTELEAQVARMRALGLEPTHIDSHQHVHGFGTVFAEVARHCEAAHLPMRVPWVAGAGVGGIARRLRRGLLAWMLARATRRWRGRVAWNDDLGSVFDLGIAGGTLDDAPYRRILEGANGSSFELMVHPVTSAAAMEGYTRIGAVGEAEWRYLRQGRLATLADGMGFRLGSYRDLPA